MDFLGLHVRNEAEKRFKLSRVTGTLRKAQETDNL
jgi:hypothetical protein